MSWNDSERLALSDQRTRGGNGYTRLDTHCFSRRIGSMNDRSIIGAARNNERTRQRLDASLGDGTQRNLQGQFGYIEGDPQHDCRLACVRLSSYSTRMI